ncbi:DprA-like winged helix domain-containing protein [Wolbachia endosymbiont of Litomosoides brasiliensis]|uniref:DprA-like winged helix domain-containing protein n=1 Tax=Wolbachia endosymbiont of Litomosoides brasiliensis TaxID=1812117 RepID=UPI0034E19DE1
MVNNINSVPIDIDKLILTSGLSTNLTLIALLELELKSKIKRSIGNKVSMIFLIVLAITLYFLLSS